MADFLAALSYTGLNEGGFQANPSDPGNWYNGELLGTNWGISAPVARANGWLGRMEDMPQSFADSIYRSLYWPGLEAIQNQGIASKIFDMRVNFGKGGGDRLAQTALISLGWSLVVDGEIGPQTRSAINQENPESLMAALCASQENAYRADAAQHPEKQTFLSSWIERARRIPPGLALGIAAGGFSVLGLALVLALAYYSATKS